VAILDLKPADPALLDRLQAGPGEVMVLQASVLEQTEMLAAAEAVRAKFGPVEMLLNVAGGHRPQAITTPTQSFFDLSVEGLRQVIDLNLMGTILPTQVFAQGMAERGEGVILNISSVSSFQPMTRVVAYAAAKAAINNFTQWLAVHFAQEYSPKIRVNAIAPGFYLTDTNRALLTDIATGELTRRGETIIEQTPMGRFGNPTELLSTALWLLSPASSFVTGVIVPVDGGFTAYSGV
jgi:NAD(P)-dependent dehydrogenase (short-subunit alcohol dehydrogenase family)